MEATPPHALIVDDDAITLRFFEAAFHEFGWTSKVCGDGASAIAMCSGDAFDLLVIDRHLPDMRGDALLNSLRAANATAPAIATSAEVNGSVRDALLGAGFDDVVAKPLSIDDLRRVVRRISEAETRQPAIVLDDAGALAALGGNRHGLHALRHLLADELAELRATNFDTAALDGRLHRLRASCGFCGATELSDAAAQLQLALRDSPTTAQLDIERFFALCDATASALRAAR